MGKFDKTILFCLLIICLLTAVRYLESVDYWLVDMFSHFPFQYALLSFGLLLICLWRKNTILAAVACVLFIFNLCTIIDFGESIQAAVKGETSFKVYSANIYRFNKDLSRLSREIEEIDADIVLLTEVTAGHIEMLQPLIQRFPYYIEFEPFGELGIGPVVLSKFPVLTYSTAQLSEDGNFMVKATLDINQRKTMLYAVHAVNPSIRKFFPDRNRQFMELADEISEKSIPVIVAGDFNTTPYSPIFKKLLKISRLKDSRAGFGWQPSWPTFFPLLWIPIDHILVSPEIQVLKRATGSYVGSDHYPVYAEFSIN